MAQRLPIYNELSNYYDLHATEEDQMGETSDHADLVSYLMDVLHWHFHGQQCALYENLNFYQAPKRRGYPLAPDIAVIKGIGFRRVRSWRISKTSPAPQVVFEVASGETWRRDLREKPTLYARLGIEEYFAYDPNDPPLLRATSRRLYGWRLDRNSQMMQPIAVREHGSLWSLHLESLLVPDGKYLRLYDREGNVRLTRAEAEAEAKQAALRQAEVEAKRADAEAEAKEAALRQVEALVEKLRSLGIDPNQL